LNGLSQPYLRFVVLHIELHLEFLLVVAHFGLAENLTVQCHEIFDFRLFPLNCPCVSLIT
jgi:hypothetical protein